MRGHGGAGVDHTTIQAAVDAASAGDTIEVRSGTHDENVDVGKRLTLIGEGADVVTVRATSSKNCVFREDRQAKNSIWQLNRKVRDNHEKDDHYC